MITPINFDDSLYDDTVSGMSMALWCNKKYKPSSYDLSYDTRIEQGDVWFVKRDFLSEFFQLLPCNCPQIKIVTQHSDYEVDDDIVKTKPSCVSFIFGSNTTSTHNDAVPIPLGLGPSYCHLTPKSKDIKCKNTRKDRSRLLYANFRTETYPKERVSVFEKIQTMNDSDVTLVTPSKGGSDISVYLEELVSHMFSVCPRGNGIDTHRIWESLYCRTIPIVRYENAHRNFKDLPILFIDDWSILSEEYLHKEYERMTHTIWDYSKLSASWWGQQFKMEKQ